MLPVPQVYTYIKYLLSCIRLCMHETLYSWLYVPRVSLVPSVLTCLNMSLPPSTQLYIGILSWTEKLLHMDLLHMDSSYFEIHVSSYLTWKVDHMDWLPSTQVIWYPRTTLCNVSVHVPGHPVLWLLQYP